MTIQQCRYVLEIARLGSFSQAAKQLFVAQSSLSISVKSLEGELGIIIFERSSGGVRLTEAGSEFIKYAREIVESSDFLSERYSKPRAQKKLFIATQHYDFIADIFAEFLASRDDEYYKLSIREIETHSVILEVESAYSDIGKRASLYANYRGGASRILPRRAPAIGARRAFAFGAEKLPIRILRAG